MNIIWVVSDTLRKDHVGVYGNKTIRTPSIDSFAEKSIRFDRHYIAAFPTMPTRADHLTGRWTMSYMQWEPLHDEEVTLPAILRENGLHTAAVVDTPFFIKRGMNYDRGFLTFIDIPGQVQYVHLGEQFEGGDVRLLQRLEADKFAPRTFTESMEWLEYHYKENFFLYIDTWDPHEPWDPPNYYTELYWPGFDGEEIDPPYGYWQDTPGLTEEKVKKAHAAYCGEITMVDTWFGYFMRRVENMGLLDNTAIIFTSDHGFYFGEHGGLFGKMVFAKDKETGQALNGIWAHSPFYEEVAAIPLLIYVPGISSGSYSGLTSAVDLMPTVLDILDIEIPSRVEGKSLLPMVKDQSAAGRDYVVSAHPFINAGDKLRSVDDITRVIEKDSTATVTTDEWSLLYNVDPGASELYHLPSDPHQERNIINEKPEKARELHQILIQYMKETNISEHIMNQRLELRI
ncbi:MAG: sulfatase [Deltaproteobacteria bacterium]|nr:sulfatase [Deltaproteobacteria bacterium]